MKQTKSNLLSLLGIIAGIFAVAFEMASCKTEVEPPAPITYTVTYSSADYGTTPEAITVEENTVLSASQLPELSDDAAVFKGWFDGDTKAVPGEYQVKGNVELTAHWSQLATITYHSKFGTVPESFELERNQTLTSEKVAPMSSSPYTFLGWFDSEDDDHNGTGEQINAGLAITNNTDLYAKWKTATVSFTTQYGTNPASIKKYTGEKITETEIPALTARTGYTSDGWFNGSTQLTTDYTVNGDVTFTEKWSVNTYLITFKANDETDDDYTQTVTYATTAKLKPNTFTREGYTFNGWNLAANGSGTGYADKADFTVNEANGVTLYAQWTPNEYTITYKANGGTGSDYTQTVTFGTTVKLAAANTFTHTGTGLCFAQWNTDADGEGANYSAETDFTVTEANDITLYARWENIVTRIKNMTESGTIVATGTCTTDTIESINRALKNLCSSHEDVLVTLDLSGVKGLSELERASFGVPSSYYSFYGCSNLEGIILPSSVTKIGEHAFTECSGLTEITIPSSVTEIGNYTFRGCSGLTSITIPSSVTEIGKYTFYGCSGLTSITIPPSVTSIGQEAFCGCSGLTSITIPSSVTSIGLEAFYGCSSLTSITIPSSVTEIGREAFYGCSSLTSITIPSGVTSIEGRTFYRCSGLTSITIPSSVTSIGNSAFEGCSGLTSITIPSSVTSIGNSAFNGCSGLTSITIPSSVTSIEYLAFYGCSGLTDVTFADTESSWDFYSYGTKKGTRKMSATDTVGNATLLKSTYVNCLWRKQQ